MAQKRTESERTPTGELLHQAEQCAALSGDFGMSGIICAIVALAQVMEEMNETIGSVIGYSNIETDQGDIVTPEFLRVMGGAIK